MRAKLAELTSKEFQELFDGVFDKYESIIPTDDMADILKRIKVTPETEAYIFAFRDACVNYCERYNLRF
jgi:hypothetical protein